MARWCHNTACLAGLNKEGQCVDETFYPVCRMKNQCPTTGKAFTDNPKKHIYRKKMCPYCRAYYTNPSFWNRIVIDFKQFIKDVKNFNLRRLIKNVRRKMS